MSGVVVNSEFCTRLPRHFANSTEHFWPLWRRATSDVSLSSVTSVLLWAFWRIVCRVVLRWHFSLLQWMTFDMFCSHNLSFRCSADHFNKCGTSYLAGGVIWPIVNSAPDLRNCVTVSHRALAEVLVLISGNASDTALGNRARYGSPANKTILYWACFDDCDFSIHPKTLNICLSLSIAPSNRWSLSSNVPAYDCESVNSRLCVCRQMTK